VFALMPPGTKGPEESGPEAVGCRGERSFAQAVLYHRGDRGHGDNETADAVLSGADGEMAMNTDKS
jgi:hypothetical protein